MILRSLLSFALAAIAGSALSAPVLRADVMVDSAVVTVGDMFDDAGILAEQPLFRAPSPGTSGLVSLDDLRIAAARVGLTTYDTRGVDTVIVARVGVQVDAELLGGMIEAELGRRGIVGAGMTVALSMTGIPDGISAQGAEAPVALSDLRYVPENGSFTARFLLVGTERPLDVSGRADISIEVPHLLTTMPAGTVLTPADIEMRAVSLRFADANGVLTLDQLVGKALTRQSRAGLMLAATDIADPNVIARNDIVTVYLHTGQLTLTVRGQALNAAPVGATIPVLSLMSSKVLYGIVTGPGSVEISAGPTALASL